MFRRNAARLHDEVARRAGWAIAGEEAGNAGGISTGPRQGEPLDGHSEDELAASEAAGGGEVADAEDEPLEEPEGWPHLPGDLRHQLP